MKKFKLISKLLILVLLCNLSGCTQYGHASYKTTKDQKLALQEAEKLMQLSSQSNDQQAATYKLQAIGHLIAADSIDTAERALNQDFNKGKLNQYNAAYKQILLAQVNLAKQNLTAANQHLHNIATPSNLAPDLLVKFYTTRSESSRRSGNLVHSVQDRIALSKHLPSNAEQKINNAIIWDTLSQLTPNNLKALQGNYGNQTLNGWLSFASITKQYDASSEQLLRALNIWQRQYPEHPALDFVPYANKQDIDNESSNRKFYNKPKKIALLLPLKGTHEKSAQAVRDGFLAAFYAHKATSKPAIQVYDTTQSDLNSLYRQVVNEGADFIVGPLTKEEVDIISDNVRSEIPVLTLNNSSNHEVSKNIFQFSLSPEMEAQAVATKAWRDGHRNAIVITPKSAWGKRMLNAFRTTWNNLGGRIVDVEEIQSQTNLNPGIKRLLGVDGSEARAQQLKQAGIKFSFNPRRRQDIDMVFIATNSALARQVKPLLNFYFAADLPAYASSSVFSGKSQPSLDQDLNGIQFCDMPWILDAAIGSRSTYKAVAESWPEDFDQYARLYALGLDAYKVSTQIDQLTMMPELGISGMTGMLTLDKQQYIQRKLIWASFKKGMPFVNGEQS